MQKGQKGCWQGIIMNLLGVMKRRISNHFWTATYGPLNTLAVFAYDNLKCAIIKVGKGLDKILPNNDLQNYPRKDSNLQPLAPEAGNLSN